MNFDYSYPLLHYQSLVVIPTITRKIRLCLNGLFSRNMVVRFMLAYVIDRRCFRIPNKNRYCISTKSKIDLHNGEVIPCILFKIGGKLPN